MTVRIGVISDVHGNLHALKATLATLRTAAVDRIVCAGDLVGYGPYPNECVRLVAGMGLASVAGNHDLMAIGCLPDYTCGSLVRRSQSWTRSVLTPETRLYLESLPARLELGEVIVAHGALANPEIYVRSETDAIAQLTELARHYPDAATLVLGHTHRPWVYGLGIGPIRLDRERPMELTAGRPHLINPGSVGQSRHCELRPLARFMVLDMDRHNVESYAVRYDHGSCAAALRERGLPRRSMHLRPTPHLWAASRSSSLVSKVFGLR